MHPSLHVTYRVRSDARSIDDRARAIAVEQSVEMPVSAIDDDFVRAVDQHMHNGTVSLILEVDERVTQPLDDIVSHARGRIFRRSAP